MDLGTKVKTIFEIFPTVYSVVVENGTSFRYEKMVVMFVDKLIHIINARNN